MGKNIPEDLNQGLVMRTIGRRIFIKVLLVASEQAAEGK